MTKLEEIRAHPTVWRTEKRARVTRAEQVVVVMRGVSAEERRVCEVCLQCFAGVTKRISDDLALISELERVRRKTTDFDMVDICDLALGMIGGYNVASRAVVHKPAKAVHRTEVVNKSVNKAEARKAYRREWMRKQREKSGK